MSHPINDTYIENLFEEAFHLFEIRGELSPEDNAKIEDRLMCINQELNDLGVDNGFILE